MGCEARRASASSSGASSSSRTSSTETVDALPCSLSAKGMSQYTPLTESSKAKVRASVTNRSPFSMTCA